MTKFVIYYGVTPSGKLETIALEERGKLGELKKQCKEDISKLGNKYDWLVVATDYGVEKRFKTVKAEKKAPAKKAPAKKAPAKKKKAE